MNPNRTFNISKRKQAKVKTEKLSRENFMNISEAKWKLNDCAWEI